MTKSLRGINLGGWLVAERWMTPGLFANVTQSGEISLVRELGREQAKQRIEEHRKSFISESDFAWIKQQGFELVRLPVGYWLFEQTDDFIDGETYAHKAFEWAKRHQLKVILDFHGLQGSQNGHDHSGQVGKVRLYRRGNQQAALRTLEYMCREYGDHSQLIAIEIINEPKLGMCLWRTLRYYERAIAVAEASLPIGVKIIVSDGFRPLRMAQALSRRGLLRSGRVVLDVHLYRVFNKDDLLLSVDEHIGAVTREWRELLGAVSGYMPVLVGEWSAALPPRADRENRNKDFYAAQAQLFESTCWAHCYWSYKAPGSGAWDYRVGSF